MTDIAYAMGGGGLPGVGGADMSFIFMMAVLSAIFYFLIFRPQQKKQKETKEMLADLSHGDTVVTSGGIQGKITGLTDNIVTLEIAEKVRVKVLRSHITAVVQKAGKD